MAEANALLHDLCAEYRQPEAEAWYLGLLDAVLTWDHIVDGDPIDKDCADRAFVALLVDWGLNGWYQKHAVLLAPVLVAMIDAWRSSDQAWGSRIKAYDAYTEVPCAMAFLMGGHAAVRKYGWRFRELAEEMRRLDDSAAG